MRQRDQQKLISFGRCYHYAIPDTNRISTRQFSRVHDNDEQQTARIPMPCEHDVVAPDVTSKQNSEIPVGQRWANDIPPWSSQGFEGDDDMTIRQIACTFQSTLFLTASGKIYQQGLLHGFMMAPIPIKITIPLPLKCIQISAGRHFCLALLEGGLAVASW